MFEEKLKKYLNKSRANLYIFLNMFEQQVEADKFMLKLKILDI